MKDCVPFRVCPDYYQFYLQDGAEHRNAPETIWDADLRRRFLTAPGVVAVYTFDPNTVSGEVVVEEAEPEVELESWDHVGECDLAVTSGSLALRTPTVAPRPLKLNPLMDGVYRVRLSIRGLDRYTSEDPDDPDRDSLEFYRFALWVPRTGAPTPPESGMRVLKQWQGRKRA
jgi:hypothetical protein